MKFWKYCAAGNDFLLIVSPVEDFDQLNIAKICDRRFGIGADGLLMVDLDSSDVDFKMKYYNADGAEVDMCGNGARSCAHWFSHQFAQTKIKFRTANDSLYSAEVLPDDLVKVSMNELKDYDSISVGDFYPNNEVIYLNTGVPHTVIILGDEEDLSDAKWMNNAPKLRSDKRFSNGCNINFVKINKNEEISLRTFERGVEAETLACGTGAVAAARILSEKFHWNRLTIHVAGGILRAELKADECWLAGPAVNTFIGEFKAADFLI